MNTYLYLVRHGDSPKFGDERNRGLTQLGEKDANRVASCLKAEGINAVVSSPYIRSILTVEKLANELGQNVLVYEDLKERIFSAESNRISDEELFPLLEKSFSNTKYSLVGAESNAACQERAINILKELLVTYRGQRVVIGTHGLVMTLMMNYYDSAYDLNFLYSTSKPDIYKLEFINQDLVRVERKWEP